MALFGEKCIRCGKRRTKREYEGLPTCEACQAILLARKKAASEETRSCPVDGATMEKDVVLNVVIDRCPSCGGAWLDSGELELIRSAVVDGVVRSLARASAFPV